MLKSKEKINSVRYIEVLNDHALPFYKKITDHYGDTIFQQDRARYHTSKLSIAWLKGQRMLLLDWPAQILDPNLIENLWRILKLRISQMRHQIHSLSHLEEILKEEWEKVKQSEWSKLIQSMKKRCRLVNEAKGGSIKY